MLQVGGACIVVALWYRGRHVFRKGLGQRLGLLRAVHPQIGAADEGRRLCREHRSSRIAAAPSIGVARAIGGRQENVGDVVKQRQEVFNGYVSPPQVIKLS